MTSDIIDTLRQPEYTGEDRCEPCTVLNVGIAGVLGAVVGRKSRRGGYAVVLVALALIYLRGYLVPGTPTLTKRYLPPSVLRWFGKDPEVETRSGLGSVDESADSSTDEAAESASETADDESADRPEEVDVHDYLLAEGVLEPCEDRDDLCLVDDFERAWGEEITALSGSELDASEAVAALGLDTDGETVEIENHGDAWTLVTDAQTVGQWPSRSALVADVAAARTLEAWAGRWDELPPAQAGQILNGLRLFLEQCPDGNGSVSIDQKTVESCCSSHEVVAVTCDETGERLFEQPVSEA